MRYLQVLLLLCALCVLAAVENKDDPKANHHSKEKSHQHKHRNEKAHVVDRHKKTEIRTHSNSYFKHLAVRDGNRHCRVICNESQSNVKDIQIFYNGDASLIAYLNQSASIAVIQDYASNTTAFLNGKSGTAIVEDIGENKYYSIEKSAQTEEALWLSSKSDFATFFKNPSSLKKLVKTGEEHGKAINREDLAKAKAPYLIFLDVKASEGTFTLNIDFVKELNSTLGFIFKGQGNFTIHKHIYWFVNVSQAFADIFRDTHNQLQSLNIKLNLTRIYGVDSGVEALVNLLTQLGTRVDLAKILRNELSSPEKMLELLAKLSGGSEEGIDGMITVVITVIRATNGHASINDVINAILNYKPDGDDSSLTKVVDDALKLIESQNRVYNNSQAFQGTVTVLKAINNRNLVYRNINISDILTLLSSRNPVRMIEVIIRIFSRFAGSEGFPQIIRDFIQGLNSSSGLDIIRRLFPSSNLDNIRHCIITALSNIPFIGKIFRNPFNNVTGSFNPSSIISAIPVVGPAIANASSGVVSGFEDAIGNVVRPFSGGSGSSDRPISPANTGSTKATDTGSEKPNCTKSSAPVTEDPILKIGNVHQFHEKKDRHHYHEHAPDRLAKPKVPENDKQQHFKASKQKENLHHKHNLQGKEHHGHLKDSNRKQNFHQKHNLLEKDQHGHVRGSSRTENVHYRHKLHEKKAQEKIHEQAIHEKKYENNHNHH